MPLSAGHLTLPGQSKREPSDNIQHCESHSNTSHLQSITHHPAKGLTLQANSLNKIWQKVEQITLILHSLFREWSQFERTNYYSSSARIGPKSWRKFILNWVLWLLARLIFVSTLLWSASQKGIIYFFSMVKTFQSKSNIWCKDNELLYSHPRNCCG